LVKQPFEVFKENIAKARELMRLAELKEVTIVIDNILEPLKERKLLQTLRTLRRPLGIFPSLKDIRMLIKEKSDKIYEVGLPQILVFVIACLEAYLRGQYHIINPSDRNIDRYRFLRLNHKVRSLEFRKRYRKVLKRDIFQENEILERELIDILEKRHAIAHGLRELKLNSTVVSHYLDIIEEIVLLVQNACKSS